MARSSVLVIVILVVTLPFWITVGGIFFGAVMGIIGGIFGLIGGLFGMVFGLIGAIFGVVWHIMPWNWHFPHFFGNLFFAAVIVAIVLAIAKKGKR